MDDELNALCLLVLKNALYRKLERVTTAYFAAAEGLEFISSDLYEVHAFNNPDIDFSDDKLNIYTMWPGKIFEHGSCGHDTLVEALEHEPAHEVWVEGLKVFERRNGKWFYVEGEKNER